MGVIRHNTTFYKIVNTIEDDFCEIAYMDDMKHQHDWKFADKIANTINELWGLESADFAIFSYMFAEIQEGWMVDADGCYYLVSMTDANTITITA